MTLHDLRIMAEGRDRDQWLHTATVLAKLHNVNVTKEDQVVDLADFYPYVRRPKKSSASTWDPFNTDDDKRDREAGLVRVINPADLPITYG